MQDSKKLTVSFGTFACVLEGFDDPFDLMTRTVSYFKEVADRDPGFGRYDEFADFEELSHRIAEETGLDEFELAPIPGGVHIRSLGVAAATAVPVPLDIADTEDFQESEETAEQSSDFEDRTEEGDEHLPEGQPEPVLTDEMPVEQAVSLSEEEPDEGRETGTSADMDAEDASREEAMRTFRSLLTDGDDQDTGKADETATAEEPETEDDSARHDEKDDREPATETVAEVEAEDTDLRAALAAFGDRDGDEETELDQDEAVGEFEGIQPETAELETESSDADDKDESVEELAATQSAPQSEDRPQGADSVDTAEQDATEAEQDRSHLQVVAEMLDDADVMEWHDGEDADDAPEAQNPAEAPEPEVAEDQPQEPAPEKTPEPEMADQQSEVAEQAADEERPEAPPAEAEMEAELPEPEAGEIDASPAEAEIAEPEEEPSEAAAAEAEEPAEEEPASAPSNVYALTERDLAQPGPDAEADEPAPEDEGPEVAAAPLVLKKPALRLGPQMASDASRDTGKLPDADRESFIDSIGDAKTPEAGKQPAAKPAASTVKPAETPAPVETREPAAEAEPSVADKAAKAARGLGKLKVSWLRGKDAEEDAPAAEKAVKPHGAQPVTEEKPAEKPAAAESSGRGLLRIINADRKSAAEAPAPAAAEKPAAAEPAHEVAEADAKPKPAGKSNMADRLHASFAEPVKPATGDTFSLGEASEDDDPFTPEGFVRRAGSSTLIELMEACAAYTVLVQGESSFSRNDIMAMVQEIAGKNRFSAEARIKAFGKLVRGGQFIRFEGGTFAPSPDLVSSHKERVEDIAV